MKTASKQIDFGLEHGLSMHQHDRHSKSDNNDVTQGIADIITGLSQSASENKEMIKSTLTDTNSTIKAFQEE